MAGASELRIVAFPVPRKLLLWAALAMAATACARDMSVTVRMGDRPPNPDKHPGTSRGELVASGASGSLAAAGVNVDRFQIVLRDIRLESSPTQNGERTADEAIIGPGATLVDLSAAQLDPAAMTEIVPGGPHIAWSSYYEVDVDLAPVTQAEVDADAKFAPLLGSSFVIQGRTATGGPFIFKSSLQKVLVRPATFRDGFGHNNTTINIAPNLWFIGADGSVLDPASADPAVHAAIESNVAASLDGYMDDNADGNPDPLG